MLHHAEPPNDRRCLELAAELVAAYVANNSVPAAELPALLVSVHRSLDRFSGETTAKAEPAPAALRPAVPIKTSVHNDYIVCLEDGRQMKSLKRHLASAYGLTPDQYRKRWSLPRSYPMVAPGYANMRSELARKLGLGRRKVDDAPRSAEVSEVSHGRETSPPPVPSSQGSETGEP